MQDWTPPSHFDDFQLVRELGQGGMGRVFLAKDELLDRFVALKFVAEQSPNQAALERFLLEARAIARLMHPNVVAVHRVGRVEGRPYLACEYVPGQSLDKLPKPVGWRELVRLGVGIARGLAAAHRRGVLHRDVKPANIVVSESGEPKLLDFGLAKLADAAPPVATAPREPLRAPDGDAMALNATVPAEGSPSLTRTGALLGTPMYLAPELWAGEEPSPRSDVFSLGLVLYELAAGQLPRTGTRPDSVALPLPPLTGAPEELARIIARCTSRLPEERFRSAEDVRDALEKIETRALPASPRASQASVEEPAVTQLVESGQLALPETRYARNGSVNIAYQVLGSGPVDLVVVPGWISHVELQWQEPSYARFLRALASFSRLIVLDKRGTGLSDRLDSAATLDQRTSDVRAVMDAAGSDRAVLFGASEGGALAAMFAATYPERTLGMVLYGAAARSLSSPDVPGAMPAEMWEFAFEQIRSGWGTPVFLEMEAPSRADDPEFARWWAHFLKNAASPGAAVEMLRLNSQIDIQAVLPSVQCPTLVLHRRGDRLMPFELGRLMAAGIPGARFVELEGDDHIWFVGNSDAIVEQLREMARQAQVAASVSHVLGTVLALGDATLEAATRAGKLEELGREVEREVARFGGTPLQTFVTDRALAFFPSASDAVRAARAIVTSLGALGVRASAGLHLGAARITPEGATGAAVDDARALASSTPPGQVVVSLAVRDVLPGTGIETEASGLETFRVVSVA